MSSQSVVVDAYLSSSDTTAIVAETKWVVELWKTMNNARLPIPLKEPCQILVQQIEDSLRESSKVANKGKNLTENGLDMWKEDRKETFQENYVRKSRGEAEAVISALRGVRNSANKLLKQIDLYLKQTCEEGASGRGTSMTKSLEIMQKIVGHREQMNFNSLIKLWFYVNDEILSCIEKNLDYMDTTIDFLRKQVENQWSTLGQIYVDYTTEFGVAGLDHDIKIVQKESGGWDLKFKLGKIGKKPDNLSSRRDNRNTNE